LTLEGQVKRAQQTTFIGACSADSYYYERELHALGSHVKVTGNSCTLVIQHWTQEISFCTLIIEL
jgi:hypothetical protein